MIAYLLLPALVLGDVGQQRLNVTEEELNGTFSVSTLDHTVRPAATTETDAVTLGPYGDERTTLEDGLQGNQTWHFLTEEDEGFQEQEDQYPWRYCPWELLVQVSQLCGEAFYSDMSAVSAEDRCVLEKVIRPYNKAALCMETITLGIRCFYPNAVSHDFFLHLHSAYFHACAEDEPPPPPLQDAPHGLVVVLTLAPVSLLPLLVYMVAWRSKTTS